MPNLGLGVGLRSVHFDHILAEWPAVDWFEAISENFLDSRGWPRHVLQRVSRRYPVVLHGVSMSIGSTDPLDIAYLERLRGLADAVHAAWVSDHLCWTGVGGHTTHDLLPLPRTPDSLAHVVDRVRRVQDVLGRRIVLENPSSYLEFVEDSIPEWAFLGAIADQGDCGILLDVNNVHVSSTNHGWDPLQYIDGLPHERIVQLHLAGHTDTGTFLLDSHIGPVPSVVWRLYREVVRRLGPISTLLEWDSEIPDFPTLHAEVLRARGVMQGEVPAAGPPIGDAVSNPLDFLSGSR